VHDLLQQAEGTPAASAMQALLQGSYNVGSKGIVHGTFGFGVKAFTNIELKTAGCSTLHERYASLTHCCYC
jgi:hypothetical protein